MKFKIPALGAIAALALNAAVLPAPLLAEEGGEPQIENIDFSFDGIFGSYDPLQLQRGLKVYTEVCSACHGLKFVPIRSLAEPGGVALPEEQVRAYATRFEVFDKELNDFRPAKETDNFPPSQMANAPDLSLMAKARAGFHGPYGTGINQLVKGMGGPEYITSLLQSYTGKEKEEAGVVLYENTAFPGGWIGMPPPLAGGEVEFDDQHPNELRNEAEDVSAFLMWTAEPKLPGRKYTGLLGVLFLTLLAGLLYLTNKRIWAPVKRRDKRETTDTNA
ncbi:cytochrome c1 [Brevirhabdus sp.]|uniref:cytochrome c1 n=1 Tax=Brevirhabdus sp. TaxID=2004514 RepID=UPI0040599CD1